MVINDREIITATLSPSSQQTFILDLKGGFMAWETIVKSGNSANINIYVQTYNSQTIAQGRIGYLQIPATLNLYPKYKLVIENADTTTPADVEVIIKYADI